MGVMTKMTAMAAPVGLYAHVRANHRRSLLLLGCFLVAFHLMSAAVLTVPLAVFDPEHGPLTGFAGYLWRYLLPVTAIGALLFAIRYWWHVSAVRKDTGFHYVDEGDEPRLVKIIEPLIIAAGLHPPFLGVIEDPAMNAFAVGVREKHMVVVVTRGLIDGLDDEEIESVLAHELMHIRFRDTRLMAAANAFLGNLSLLRKQVINDAKLEQPRAVLGFILLPGVLPLFLGLGFLGELAHRIGYFSRAAIGSAREFIADAEAVRLTHNPAALASALRKVSGRDRIAGLAESHDAMLIAGAVDGPAATHPGIAQRIAALVQTTGPAMAYAPIRRDTRTPEQRRRSGFGKAIGASLMDEVRAARRPTLWQIFRLARDPERNIFGLRRYGRRVVLAGAIGFFLLWGGIYFATGRKADVRVLRTTAAMMRLYTTCQIHGIGRLAGVGSWPAECSNANVEALTGTFSSQTGMPFQSEAERVRKEKAADLRSWRMNRCFPYSRHPWTVSPTSFAAPADRATWDLSFYREAADRPIAGVDAPAAPGMTPAQSLAAYIDMRVLMADNGRYYFGADGYGQIAAMFDAPRHRHALEVFRKNMERPDFAAWYAKHGDSGESARLLAEMPDAVPCEAIPEESFKRS